MDVQRTIEFILESQAKAETRMDKAHARAAAFEKRLDKRMDAIAKLLHQGMRVLGKTQAELAGVTRAQRRTDGKLAELAEAQKELAEAQKELAEAQKATDRSLKALIDSLRNGRNGKRPNGS